VSLRWGKWQVTKSARFDRDLQSKIHILNSVAHKCHDPFCLQLIPACIVTIASYSLLSQNAKRPAWRHAWATHLQCNCKWCNHAFRMRFVNDTCSRTQLLAHPQFLTTWKDVNWKECQRDCWFTSMCWLQPIIFYLWKLFCGCFCATKMSRVRILINGDHINIGAIFVENHSFGFACRLHLHNKETTFCSFCIAVFSTKLVNQLSFLTTCFLRCTKSYTPFELFACENYKWCLREVRLSMSLGVILSPLRRMMLLHEESAWQLQTRYLIGNNNRCNDSSCSAKQNKTCSDRMQLSTRHNPHVTQTVVLWRWFVTHMSNLLHF